MADSERAARPRTDRIFGWTRRGSPAYQILSYGKHTRVSNRSHGWSVRREKHGIVADYRPPAGDRLRCLSGFPVGESIFRMGHLFVSARWPAAACALSSACGCRACADTGWSFPSARCRARSRSSAGRGSPRRGLANDCIATSATRTRRKRLAPALQRSTLVTGFESVP